MQSVAESQPAQVEVVKDKVNAKAKVPFDFGDHCIIQGILSTKYSIYLYLDVILSTSKINFPTLV